jgi:DNA-binding FadR family transcriptional regulator
MRTLIEPPAARLIAERNSAAAVPVLRQHIETERSLVPDRFAVSHAVAEFHNVMMELAGNKTLLMFAQALRGLVSAHLQLAQHHLPPTPERDLQKSFRRGFNSHAKLVDLIEAEDGAGAEAHWREHMIAAGKTWLGKIGPNSVVDLIG